ncbi:hypothetical protein VCHC62B1_0656B, partial [Vibrio cholerae HC-62B1]
PIAERFAPTI